MTKTKEELAEEWSINELSKTDAHGLERLLLHLWTLDAYNAGYKEGYEAGQPKWIKLSITQERPAKYLALSISEDIAVIDANEILESYLFQNYTHWMPIPTLPTKENEK